MDLTLIRLNLVHISISVHFHIIILATSIYSKLSLSFKFIDKTLRKFLISRSKDHTIHLNQVHQVHIERPSSTRKPLFLKVRYIIP